MTHSLVTTILLGSVVNLSSGLCSAKAFRAFEFHNGVIVAPDRSVAYIMDPRGRIDAVDVSSGKLLWSSTDAAKPLLLDGKHLVAQAESHSPLRIVLLDTENAGKRVLAADVALPDGVVASINASLGTSFNASARMDGKDVIVSWRYIHQHITGAAPGPEALRLNRQAAGAARIDPATGRVEPLKPEEVPTVRKPALPEKVAQLVTSGELEARVLHAGKLLAAVTRSIHDGTRRIILKRWDAKTGAPLADVMLFNEDEKLTMRFPSADTRHVLASKLIQAAGPIWQWSIFSLETGQRVARIRNSSPGDAFFIAGSRLIYESPPTMQRVNGKEMQQPLQLHGMDLTSGKEIWIHAVRDTRYRGPSPPALPGRARPPGKTMRVGD